MKGEIERLGGVVEKFVGDAVMAVFGATKTREDDAERAVRSALAATEAIDALNDAHPGLDLAVRAAVNTGEAVVVLRARPERGEAMVAGDVVNTASRLQQAAPVVEVVVGELTYRSTRGAIDYEALPLFVAFVGGCGDDVVSLAGEGHGGHGPLSECGPRLGLAPARSP